jgi:hypothetical protein
VLDVFFFLLFILWLSETLSRCCCYTRAPFIVVFPLRRYSHAVVDGLSALLHRCPYRAHARAFFSVSLPALYVITCSTGLDVAPLFFVLFFILFRMVCFFAISFTYLLR